MLKYVKQLHVTLVKRSISNIVFSIFHNNYLRLTNDASFIFDSLTVIIQEFFPVHL